MSPNVIGIDVAKDWLDGFHLATGHHSRLNNTPKGHAKLIIPANTL